MVNPKQSPKIKVKGVQEVNFQKGGALIHFIDWSENFVIGYLRDIVRYKHCFPTTWDIWVISSLNSKRTKK